MSKPRNKVPGTGSRPPGKNGKGLADPASLQARPAPAADPSRNDPVIEKVRQIIAETPEIRPERVGPLQEAVEQGAYEIDARKVANSLITKLIQDPDTPV
ncbi:MAG: flagellar biosynthesis anti-sigma factor FlgM [Desulfobaccales bacterium]